MDNNPTKGGDPGLLMSCAYNISTNSAFTNLCGKLETIGNILVPLSTLWNILDMWK